MAMEWSSLRWLVCAASLWSTGWAKAEVPDFFFDDAWESGVTEDALLPAPDGYLQGVTNYDDAFSHPAYAYDTRGPHWHASVEATFLNPDFNGALVQAVITDPLAVSVTSFTLVDVSNLYVAPRLTLEVHGETWGVACRYWHLSESEISYDSFSDFGASPFSTQVLAETRFEAYAVDLELARRFCFGPVNTQLGFGARHAALTNDAVLWTADTINGDLVSSFAGAFRDFHGTGLTIGWQGSVPICAPNLHLFWNGRTSVLWGDIATGAETSASVISGAGAGATFTADGAEISDDMFIGELQLGFQWNYQLRSVPAIAFFRVAGEYQYWDASGGDALASAVSGQAGNSEIITTVNAAGVRADLIGLAIATGLNW